MHMIKAPHVKNEQLQFVHPWRMHMIQVPDITNEHCSLPIHDSPEPQFMWHNNLNSCDTTNRPTTSYEN